MSITKCMVCQKYRQPVRNYRNLLPAGCIGCGTQQDWQKQINSTEKWQEICLTPHKFAREDFNTPISKQPDSPLKEQTQYLQIGYRHNKQHWSTKAFHIFGKIVRRRNSTTPSTRSNQSQDLSGHSSSSGVETTESENRSQGEWPTEPDIETQTRKGFATSNVQRNPLSKCDQESKIHIIGQVHEGFDEPTESGVDVLTLMQHRYRNSPNRAVSVPASEHTLSLKCCCSDADLTKPSMCGDRACVSCSVHDHRLIARQVSMAAEAAAQAAASVLAVPLVSVDAVDPRDVQQLSYTSVTTVPANPEIHEVLHSVRSALEQRQRRFRPEPIAHTSVPSQTICVQHTEAATCTSPPTQDAQVQPILLTLSKMYQKHLYISALFHNLTSFDVKKLGCRVNECRTKIEALEDVCKQQQKIAPITADMAVGDEQLNRLVTVDAGVGEVREARAAPETVDTAVGEEEIRDEKVDKETQDFVDTVDKADGYTGPTNFGVETGLQVTGDEGLGVRGVAEMSVQVGEGVGLSEIVGPVESVVSEDPWRRISQISDFSSADIHSLNYCNPHLLEAYMLQFENATKTANGSPDIKLGSSAEYLRKVTAASASKAQSESTQKYRLCKPVKVPARQVIRRSPNLDQSTGRFRSTGDRRSHNSPPRQGVVPSVAIQTHHAASSRRSTAASARFAGGRSGINNFPLRRGLPSYKPTALKFVSTVRK